MSILVGIDGTGSDINPGAGRDHDYDIAFANSFVKQMCDKHGVDKTLYKRGPVALGGGLNEAITAGVTFIQNKKAQLPNEPILLTGYSRGAAGAVMIAKRLKDLNIKVKALMMFDCVDRYMFGDAEVVPSNVENVCHVIRDPAARSRATFGNDGMKYIPPTIYEGPTMFMCTHGGMGGTPWDAKKDGKDPGDFIDEGFAEDFFSPARFGPVWLYHTNVTYAQDEAVSKRVWSFVQPFLQKHGY